MKPPGTLRRFFFLWPLPGLLAPLGIFWLAQTWPWEAYTWCAVWAFSLSLWAAGRVRANAWHHESGENVSPRTLAWMAALACAVSGVAAYGAFLAYPWLPFRNPWLFSPLLGFAGAFAGAMLGLWSLLWDDYEYAVAIFDFSGAPLFYGGLPGGVIGAALGGWLAVPGLFWGWAIVACLAGGLAGFLLGIVCTLFLVVSLR